MISPPLQETEVHKSLLAHLLVDRIKVSNLGAGPGLPFGVLETTGALRNNEKREFWRKKCPVSNRLEGIKASGLSTENWDKPGVGRKQENRLAVFMSQKVGSTQMLDPANSEKKTKLSLINSY